VKKGRHRRFEEARKLKQSGPDFLFREPVRTDAPSDVEDDDDYADVARKYDALEEEPADEADPDR